MMDSIFMTILTLFLVSGLSLIVGGYFGFKLRDKAITSGEVKASIKLPFGWLVHMITQDPLDGTWRITAIAFTKPEEGEPKDRAVAYCGARTLMEAFEGIKRNIKNKNYLDLSSEEGDNDES